MARHLRRLAFVLLAGLCVAAASAKPPPLEPGLVATYTAGDRRVTRVTAAPNFTLGADETIHPQVPAEFSLTYDGVIRILQESDYSFTADGGGTIAVDGKPARTVHLAPGDHALHVDYSRKAGPARLQLIWSSPSFPAEPIPSAVIGHAATSADVGRATEVERGRLLVQDLNCVACHKPPTTTLTGRLAPDLSAASSRVTPQWIYMWLANPKHFRAQAAMPVVLKNDQDRRDVAAFLGTLKDPKPDARVVTPSAELAAAGQQLFESIGCANCHNASGPSLGGQASKWVSAAALSQYLLDPTAVDASGRMPNMLLDQGQADALAAYLFTAAPHAKLSDFEAPLPTGDAAHGQLVFRAAGCVNCHTTSSEQMKVSAPDLARLNPDAGCLAAAPPAASPLYDLPAADRQPSRATFARSRPSLRCRPPRRPTRMRSTSGSSTASPATRPARRRRM